MNKFLPETLAFSCVALVVIAFVFPTIQNNQLASVASTNTAGFVFKTKALQVEEGNVLKVTVVAPPNLTKTTRVPVQIQTGTASGSDIQTTTKYITFYRGGLLEKAITVQTKTDNVTESPETFSLKIGSSSETASVTLYEKGTVNTDGNRIVGTTTDPYTPTTTLPPTNCSQYAGVLPNNNRNVNVVQKSFPRVVYNSTYGLSAAGKTDLDLMQGDIGYQLTFGTKGPGNWNTVTIPSGTAYAYKFKTTEYNFPVHYQLALGDRPATTGGVVVTSISECPGDFTSPAVMAQTTGHDEYNTGNTVGDQKFRNCVTYGRPLNSGGGINFGIGGNTQYICALQPNKTYYLNISAGFSGGGDKGPTTPHIGTFDGTTAGTDMTADFTMYPFGHLQAVGNIGNKLWNTDIIKNRTAFYAEARRISGLFMAAGPQRTPEYTFQE